MRCIRVVVRVPEVLRRFTGGDETIPMRCGPTARSALETAFERHPDLAERVLDDEGRLRSHLRLFARSAAAGTTASADPITDLDAPLPRDAVLELVAAASGG